MIIPNSEQVIIFVDLPKKFQPNELSFCWLNMSLYLKTNYWVKNQMNSKQVSILLENTKSFYVTPKGVNPMSPWRKQALKLSKRRNFLHLSLEIFCHKHQTANVIQETFYRFGQFNKSYLSKGRSGWDDQFLPSHRSGDQNRCPTSTTRNNYKRSLIVNITK